MKEYNDFYKIRLKDIMDILGVGHQASYFIRKDVAEHFGISTKRVLYKHLKAYFKL